MLRKLNEISLILFGYVTSILILLIFVFISNIFFGFPLNKGFKTPTNNSNFFILVIVSPIIETLLFQYAIIEYFDKKTKPFISILISAIIFASLHLYNFVYFTYALSIGLVFGYIYSLKENIFSKILIITLIHFLFNLTVYLILSL